MNLEHYYHLIGQKVRKISKKPFKSQLRVATIKGVISHPILGVACFTFLEDDSYVECRRLRILFNEQ